MFKRLFFLSGVIAFFLAAFTMWFWYLPKQELRPKSEEVEMNQAAIDSVVVDTAIVD